MVSPGPVDADFENRADSGAESCAELLVCIDAIPMAIQNICAVRREST